MTLKQIIEHTHVILPFSVDGYPLSFSVLGDFKNSSIITFDYSSSLECVRNRNNFLTFWEKIHGKRYQD